MKDGRYNFHRTTDYFFLRAGYGGTIRLSGGEENRSMVFIYCMLHLNYNRNQFYYYCYVGNHGVCVREE